MREISLGLKRKELYILLLLGLFFAAFIQSLFGVLGLIQITFVIVFALIALSLLFVSTVRWKLLSYFFFVWLLLDGVFRKWVLPDYATELFFVKHFLLMGPYFYILTRGVKISKRHYPFLGLLLTYFIWGILEAFNFRVTTNFLVQILGLIVHFWFVPLIFLVPMVFDTEEKILKFFKIIAYTSVPIFILGVIQYFSPYGSWINTYADADKHTAMVGQHVRITGVFSYITPYTTYLGIVPMIVLYLLTIRRLNKIETIIMSLAISLGVANLLMTGSRGAVAAFIIQALPFLFFSLRDRLKVRKRVFIRLALMTPVLLFVMLYTETGRESFSEFVGRVESTSYDVVPRLIKTYTPYTMLSDAGLIGFGIGTAYQGSMNLVEDWGDMPRDFEGEWYGILLELGLIGFVIVMALRVYIFFYSWKVFKRTKSYELKMIALLIFIHQLLVFTGLNIVFNYLENIVYWTLVGLLVVISRLERNNAAKGFSISSG